MEMIYVQQMLEEEEKTKNEKHNFTKEKDKVVLLVYFEVSETEKEYNNQKE